MSCVEEEDWACEELEAWDYFEDFKKFVGEVTTGRFIIVATIEYNLLVQFESVQDVLTVWSSPLDLSFPLEKCFRDRVESFVDDWRKGLDESKLAGLGFRWNDVDGVLGGDVA